MSDTFLVGVDGSDYSQRAAQHAADRAKKMDAKLVVIFVIDWSPYSFNTAEENAERHKRREAEIESAREKVLNPLLSKLKSDGVEVEGMVRHGNIAKVLIEQSREHKATGMFVGRAGDSSLKTIVFGSVAANLVQASPVPVTVVP